MITREEQYLNRLAGETEQAIPEPETRKEQYLSRLCGADNIIPETPITREEQYLASLCGEEVEMPEPETRLEQYMAFAGGERENKPEPITRKEQLWDKYQGGGVIEDKTVTGTTIHVTDAIAEPASKLEVAMVPKQEHEPWRNTTPDTEPYLSRIIPRGNRSSREFHGGTIAWNQLVETSASWWSAQNNGINAYYNNLEFEFTKNTTGACGISHTLEKNHVYFVSGQFKNSLENNFSIDIRANELSYSSTNSKKTVITSSTTYENFAFIEKTDNTYYLLGIRQPSANPTNNIGYIKELCVHDLTLMFANNPAIADYAYSLEQATAGAGIAWLKSHGFIDGEYHGYDLGSLKSVNISALKIIDTDLTEHIYPITSTDLRGLFKLDAQNKLFTDGDIYPPSGEIGRRYGIVDLGTLNWEKPSGIDFFRAILSDLPSPVVGGIPDAICDKYALYVGNASGFHDKAIWVSATNIAGSTMKFIAIKDSAYSSSTATDFKTAMSGVYLVYPLATPTTETALAFTNPQIIEAGGIEEFVDSRDVKVPVGNSTIYSAEYEIEGYEGVTVYHAQTQDEPNPTEYEVLFTQQGIVYGGIIDITTGALSITWGYIASYNGETLPGEWLSSKDVYSEGTTPSTGAEVAFELASPQTYTLTAQEVQMLVGENTLWTQEEHELTLTYKSRAAQRVLAMNNKLNLNKQALELKRNGGVIIDKPIIKPISGGGIKL